MQSEALEILPADLGVLAGYVKTGPIPQDVKDALARAIALRSAVVDTERQIAERQARINEIAAEQQRIRENMKTVRVDTEYHRRLERKLNEQETTIEGHQAAINELTATRDTQRKRAGGIRGGVERGVKGGGAIRARLRCSA